MHKDFSLQRATQTQSAQHCFIDGIFLAAAGEFPIDHQRWHASYPVLLTFTSESPVLMS